MQSLFKRWGCIGVCAVLLGCSSGGRVASGYYRVKPGDTLSHIAQHYRQSVGDLTRWNSLSNPNAISSGQVLRVAPPGRGANDTSGTLRTAPAPVADAAPASTGAPASTIALTWPARGTVLRGFDGTRSKGIDIAGADGDPVTAAAAGKVVYAGNGLRGYGNLLIIKHNADFLTAYAHNRALLVKEGDTVSQGQQVATMGDTDNDRVMLHFELRYQGRSIDPARYLPAR